MLQICKILHQSFWKFQFWLGKKHLKGKKNLLKLKNQFKESVTHEHCLKIVWSKSDGIRISNFRVLGEGLLSNLPDTS
jgi:hypothetical protein